MWEILNGPLPLLQISILGGLAQLVSVLASLRYNEQQSIKTRSKPGKKQQQQNSSM